MNPYFALQWHVTEKCDQRCKHCYIYNGKSMVNSELPIEELEKILKDFLHCCELMEKTPMISVTGGDPLLYSQIWKFLELLHENSVEFSILGNPFHLNDKIAIRLKELGCYNYQMSLDGLRETHDFIRKKGSFDATLNKIECLNQAGICSTIMTTVSKSNINEIVELVPIIVEAKVKNFAFARYCPSEDDKQNMVTPEEYKDFMENMWNVFEKYKDCGTRFSLKDHLWKLFLYERGLFDTSYDQDIIFDGCHCGITHMTVLSNGDVYACRRCESLIGKVPEQSLYDIFFSQQLDEYRQFDKFRKCINCELQRFCRGCPAVAKCATGDFYAPDPQCWK